MEAMGALLERWRVDEAAVRRRMYRAPTPRERERWHAVWLLTQGWTAAAVGRALERDAHTMGNGSGLLPRADPRRWFLSRVVVPPARDVAQRGELRSAVRQLPSPEGAALSNWNCKAVRRFVEDRFGWALSRSSCLNYPVSSTGQALHRLGFVLKRPQEAVAQGRPGAAGSIRGGVCGADGGGSTDGNQAMLR